MFKDLRSIVPPIEGGHVTATVIAARAEANSKGRSVAEVHMRWTARKPIASREEQFQIEWSGGWKSIPVRIRCESAYRVAPAQIALTPVGIHESFERTVNVSGRSGQSFAVTAVSTDVPGLEVTPLGQGSAQVHTFRVVFRGNQTGIVAGRARFTVEPSEAWPVV
ncbi:unnamed protein product, partial [marine sediment metagenome]